MGGVSKDLTVNQEWVKKRFEKCDDILKRQVFLGEETSGGLSGLCGSDRQ